MPLNGLRCPSKSHRGCITTAAAWHGQSSTPNHTVSSTRLQVPCNSWWAQGPDPSSRMAMMNYVSALEPTPQGNTLLVLPEICCADCLAHTGSGHTGKDSCGIALCMLFGDELTSAAGWRLWPASPPRRDVARSGWSRAIPAVFPRA